MVSQTTLPRPMSSALRERSSSFFGGWSSEWGGLYQKDIAPSAMLTVSMPIEDIDFFAEAVLRLGSDRNFVVETEDSFFGVETISYEDELFFNGTAGFSFNHAFEEDESSVNVTCQYLYNGEGYDDVAVLTDNKAGIFALIDSGDLSFADMMNTGKHYTAVAGGWNNIFGSDFSIQMLWMHNYSDTSGWLSPSLSFALFDELSISLKTPYMYGDEGDEYTPAGETTAVQFSANLGGGRY
jgi:hypothetical protein